MWQKMEVPPAMHMDSDAYESALEHNDTVDTEIAELAKGRNMSRKTQVPRTAEKGPC
jgi:hypothetical protein